MQKKFLTNLGLLLLLNLLIKPFWILGIDRSVQNAVGTENFGIYFSLLNFAFLFNILLDFGITTYNNRNIAQNQELLGSQLSNITILKLLFALIYTAITMSVGFIIGYQTLQLEILVVLCLNQFLQSFIMYLRSNLSGLHLFKTDAYISVLDRFLMILICGILLWSDLFSQPFQIMWFVYAQTASYMVTVLFAFTLVVFKAGRVRFSWEPESFKIILKKAFPFALMILLMSVYMKIDAVMLERLLPDGNKYSGIYAQGYRLLEACNMFAYLIAVLLLPIFSKMLKEKRSVESITGLAFKLIIVPPIILCAGSFQYGQEIMELLYNDLTNQSVPVFHFLMLCFIPITTTYVFGTLLTANGNMKEINLMAAFGILINITLNFILIPHYQAKGAAIASLLTQFGVAIIQVILVQYIFRFKVKYKLITALAVFILIVGSMGYYWIDWTGIWYFNLGFLVLCSIILAMALNLINLKSINDILRIEE